MKEDFYQWLLLMKDSNVTAKYFSRRDRFDWCINEDLTLNKDLVLSLSPNILDLINKFKYEYTFRKDLRDKLEEKLPKKEIKIKINKI